MICIDRCVQQQMLRKQSLDAIGGPILPILMNYILVFLWMPWSAKIQCRVCALGLMSQFLTVTELVFAATEKKALSMTIRTANDSNASSGTALSTILWCAANIAIAFTMTRFVLITGSARYAMAVWNASPVSMGPVAGAVMITLFVLNIAITMA